MKTKQNSFKTVFFNVWTLSRIFEENDL